MPLCTEKKAINIIRTHHPLPLQSAVLIFGLKIHSKRLCACFHYTRGRGWVVHNKNSRASVVVDDRFAPWRQQNKVKEEAAKTNSKRKHFKALHRFWGGRPHRLHGLSHPSVNDSLANHQLSACIQCRLEANLLQWGTFQKRLSGGQTQAQTSETENRWHCTCTSRGHEFDTWHRFHFFFSLTDFLLDHFIGHTEKRVFIIGQCSRFRHLRIAFPSPSFRVRAVYRLPIFGCEPRARLVAS